MRIIKRYGSRKLYDTEMSQYVSLEELAALIRAGEQIQVVDNQTDADVTAQTLVQVISDEGRRGQSALSTDFLHDLIRFSERAVSKGVQQIQNLQHNVDQFVQHSLERLRPNPSLQDEVSELRKRLDLLESLLSPASNVAPLSNPSETTSPQSDHPNR